MTVHSFAITFGRIAATCIESLSSGDIAEDESELAAIAPQVFTDTSVSSFRDSVSIVFDGDLDNPDLFQSIQIKGFTGPSVASPSDYSFGNFAIYGQARLSDEHDPSEVETVLEDILHAIVITASLNDYSVDFGNWEEYSITLEDCPAEMLPRSVEWSAAE